MTRGPDKKKRKTMGYHNNHNGQKHNYNETYFATINTQNKAYWLGYLAADG